MERFEPLESRAVVFLGPQNDATFEVSGFLGRDGLFGFVGINANSLPGLYRPFKSKTILRGQDA